MTTDLLGLLEGTYIPSRTPASNISPRDGIRTDFTETDWFPSGQHGTSKSRGPDDQSTTSARDLYPHLYDEDSKASGALAVRSVLAAVSELEICSEGLRTAQMDQVWSAMGNVFALLTRAHEQTAFNEAFGVVVTFCRRATMSPDFNALDRDRLAVLEQSLRRLAATPFISLGKAVELVDELENAGWDGEHETADQFVELLLDYFDLKQSRSETIAGFELGG